MDDFRRIFRRKSVRQFGLEAALQITEGLAGEAFGNTASQLVVGRLRPV
ncbi:hypothetical protein [Amycolatopsis sp. NPDC059021]